MTDLTIPYANLNPDVILNAIESAGFQCTDSLFSLNSYENRVYQIGIQDAEPLIAKFYRPHRWDNEAIIEEHQFALELAELDIPVVAPIISETGETLHHYQDFRFALFPKQGARTIEFDNLEHLEWIGRFIGRLHAVGACRPFQHRIRLDVQSYGYQPYQFLIAHDYIPDEIKKTYCEVVESLLLKITEKFQQSAPINYIRLHGDCHAGNILWSSNGPHIVDLDDCLMGPAIQDLWMLISANTPQEMEIQLNQLLRGYRMFYDFNYQEVHLIEALRTLRMIHYSGWLAKRWEDPAFPHNFPWFNTLAYWKDQLGNLQQQEMLLEQN